MKSLNIMRKINVIKEKSYLIIFILCSIFSFLFIAGVFIYTVENNPIKLNINLENKIFTFVPQGWAFFTRNPREAQIVIYKKNKTNDLEEIDQRHACIGNLFGLNRNASKIMSELQLIKNKINDSLYQNTQWNYQNNIYTDISLKAFSVKNQMKKPILCGEYIVVFQKAVPWAWSKSLYKIKMPAKIIKLKISCDASKN